MTATADPDRWTAEKRLAANRAAQRVEDGMVVGLGTGSTAAFAIEALGRAVDEGLDVRGIPTSYQAADTARSAGVPLTTLDDVERIDLAIDGADQVADGTLIKGGGGAHAREKVIGSTAERLLIVVDSRKVVDRLDHAVPVEVLRSARRPVSSAIEDMGGEPTTRSGDRKDGPVVTDNGNFILDCDFGSIEDPSVLADELAIVPGVVEHGLFVDLADEIFVGRGDEVAVSRFEPE